MIEMNRRVTMPTIFVRENEGDKSCPPIGKLQGHISSLKLIDTNLFLFCVGINRTKDC
jgi:hypothetical protein